MLIKLKMHSDLISLLDTHIHVLLKCISSIRTQLKVFRSAAAPQQFVANYFARDSSFEGIGEVIPVCL